VSVRVSLTNRLLKRLSFLLVGGITLYPLILLAVAWATNEVDLDARLDEMARLSAELVQISPTGEKRFVGLPELMDHMGEAGDMDIAALDVATGRPIAGGAPGLEHLLRAFAEAGVEEGTFDQAGGEVLMRRVETPSGALLVAASHGAPELDDEVRWVGRELETEILPTLVPLVLATLALAALTVRRTLRSVELVSAAAREIGPGNYAHLDVEVVPVEIAPLVGAVNLAIDRLGSAVEAQRRFTANAAHELRTPLAALMIRIDALPAGEERTALARAAARMRRLVDQLLGMARLEATSGEPHRPVDLAALARQVLADVAPLAIADDKDVSYEGPDSLWIVGDAAALQAALGNLVDNAIGHAPKGGAVEIVVTQQPDIRLEVLDRGPGLPAAGLDRLTEPFWRAPGQTRSGSGLGLAIAAEAMRLHGGRLEAANRPGGGAMVSLVLPAAPDDAHARDHA
jgi:signal transduction histidine kinase